MSASVQNKPCRKLETRAKLADVDGKRDAQDTLKARLDDALRRLATLQKDITEIRREITITR